MTEPQWRRFAQMAAERHGAPSGDSYSELWQWSVGSGRILAGGGSSSTSAPPPDRGRGRRVLAEATMPGARWFPAVELNYVDQVLRHSQRRGRP